MRTRNMLLRIGALVLLFALASSLVSADPADRKLDTAQTVDGVAPLYTMPDTYPVQYFVKFVCGFVPPPGATGAEVPPVKPGNYATAINIDNHTRSKHIIAKRVHLHYREWTDPPSVRPYKRAVLYPWRVLEIDCMDIWALAGVQPETFVKGMVHIGTPARFPMAAVYTAQTNLKDPPLDAGAGISIDVEQYHPFINQLPG